MADEEIKKEEVIEETKAAEQLVEDKDEISEEVKTAMDDFDAKISGDDNSAGDDDTEGEETSEEKPAEKAEEKTEEDDAGQTDKELEEAEKAVEAELEKPAEKPAEKVEKPVEKKAEKPEEAEDEKFDCGLDPEEFDEDYIDAMNKMGQKFKDELKKSDAEKTELRRVIQQQEQDRYTDWMDRRIAGLGDDFSETLGVGDAEDIDPGSVEFENRQRLANRIGILTHSYHKLGRAIPPRNKLFDMAVEREFNDIKNKTKNEEATVEKLKKRSSQVIGGGSKKSASLTPEEECIRKQKEFDSKIDA